jgi:hydroxymethylbilane synthase
VIGLLGLLGGDAPASVLVVDTVGDRRQDVSLSTIGGQGAFVKEVQEAVLDGRADFAVHSAKDLPATTLDGLVLAAVPLRGDPRDALVGGTLAGIATGGLIATGSPRRRAQLAFLRPDLTFAELRGNIATRLSKLDREGFDAIVMAAAALHRLGLANRITEVLDPSGFIPQVGQGALAVECRASDGDLVALLGRIENSSSRRAVDAERAFLAELGGGCTLPAGAHAVVSPDEATVTDIVTVTGMLASPDGRVLLRETRSGPDGVAVGRSLARYLLDEAGGQSLLESA